MQIRRFDFHFQLTYVSCRRRLILVSYQPTIDGVHFPLHLKPSSQFRTVSSPQLCLRGPKAVIFS